MSKLITTIIIGIVAIGSIYFPIKYLESLSSSHTDNQIYYTPFNEVSVLKNSKLDYSEF